MVCGGGGEKVKKEEGEDGLICTDGLVQISPFQWKFCTQTGL